LPAAFYAPALTLLSKVSRLVYITLSAYLIMMTQSATGKIILVCLLLYVLVTKQIWKFDSKGRSIILSLAIVVGLSLLSIGGYYLNSLTYILGKDPTLTGRTEIWKSAMDSATKHPILGYGYEAFWRELQGESANVSLSNQWSVTGAHNGFLEVWLTLGIVGLGLVVYAFIRAFSDGLVCAPKSFYFSWCMCIVFLAAIISIDESGMLAGANNMFWIVFMIVCTELTKGAKRIRLGLVSE
jgi:O-antigen ligase